MTVEALVGRAVKVVNVQTKAGTWNGGTTAADTDFDLFTHTFTAIAGHTYMAIACGSAMADLRAVDNQSRHMITMNGNALVSCRAEIVRGPWQGKAGVPIRMVGVWRPNGGAVAAKWSVQRSVAWANEWALTDGRHTFIILDLGAT